MVKIICEGNSDKNKIGELLAFLDIEYNDDNFVVMGNKSNVFKTNNDNYRTLLQLIQADKIEKILFVVDADYQKDNSESGGYENTQKKLDILIQKLNIEDMSSLFISCNPISKDGYLESLLLSTVDDNLRNCYDEFLDCIELKEKNHHKYIMEQLHKITKPNKPYDFNHDNFKILRDELRSLFDNS
jgi:hypothetical protein